MTERRKVFLEDQDAEVTAFGLTGPGSAWLTLYSHPLGSLPWALLGFLLIVHAHPSLCTWPWAGGDIGMGFALPFPVIFLFLLHLAGETLVLTRTPSMAGPRFLRLVPTGHVFLCVFWHLEGDSTHITSNSRCFPSNIQDSHTVTLRHQCPHYTPLISVSPTPMWLCVVCMKPVQRGLLPTLPHSTTSLNLCT